MDQEQFEKESQVKRGKIENLKMILPGQAAYPKPFESRADKVSAQSHPEATAMSCPSQTAQEHLQANLAALQQSLQEIAANTKSSVPTTKERRGVLQGPVLVIRGK